MNRIKQVIKVSIVGILTNLLLVIFKAGVGFISGSISIISDALNNLSDAISSIVTIIGILLSGKRPDKNHPYGYGKIEHVSSLVIAIIIIGTGISTLTESAGKIITPEVADFDIPMIIIIAVAIIIKLLLGLYVKSKGQKLNSDSLIASGKDALFDVIISSSTLIGALITLIFNVTIDGWLGLIISALIIKTGIEIAMESMNHLIGTRIDEKFTAKIKRTISKHKEVLGVYDLSLHQYGPEKLVGSVHIEVKDALTAKEIHLLTREIAGEIFDKYGVILTIGIYATNTEDTEYAKIKKHIKKLIENYPNVLQMHGYYVDGEKMLISFDLVFDFAEQDIEGTIEDITSKLQEKYPDYRVIIVPDSDVSD